MRMRLSHTSKAVIIFGVLRRFYQSQFFLLNESHLLLNSKSGVHSFVEKTCIVWMLPNSLSFHFSR